MPQRHVKLGILGETGRMGQALQQALSLYPLFQAILQPKASWDAEKSDLLFQHADIVLDFSHADAATYHLKQAKKYKKPFLLGTTGLQSQHVIDVESAALDCPVLLAPNTSMGAAVFEKIVTQTASLLGTDFDIEIVETHHNQKKDSPSGTAKALATAVAKERNQKPPDDCHLPSSRQGVRSAETIGISVIRGGNIVGEHQTLFLGQDEVLQFTHRVTNRLVFAQGALQAATWLLAQPAGLYFMSDVIKKN